MSKVDPFEPHNMALAGHDFGFGSTNTEDKNNMNKETKKLLQGNDIYDNKGCKVKIKTNKPCKKKKKDCEACNVEKVDHPAHYNTGKIEVIDVIEDWNLNFNCGNAVKYIARHEHKGEGVEDIEKAIWYLNRHLTYLKEERRHAK